MAPFKVGMCFTYKKTRTNVSAGRFQNIRFCGMLYAVIIVLYAAWMVGCGRRVFINPIPPNILLYNVAKLGYN